MKKNSLRILIAPLDWGMGHTTRCMPLIGYLQKLGHTVMVAGNQWQLKLLNANFTGLECYSLSGYGIQYGGNAALTGIKIALQVPGIFRSIKSEHGWLQANLKHIRPDVIVSDNRYGLYHPSIPSVIITHQLQVLSGVGQLADNILRRTHYRFLEKFNHIWVPDIPENGLAGRLSHPRQLPAHTRYIGWLSQFEGAGAIQPENDHTLILLSGPEPQRGIWEQQLLQQIGSYTGKTMLVSGNTAMADLAVPGSNVIWHRQLTGPQLQQAISHASLVICRSGYSTLMDLALLRKPAIVVPTPGQTEQQYLATYLSGSGWIGTMQQKDFDLKKAVAMGRNLKAPQFDHSNFTMYQRVLEEIGGVV